MRIGQAIRALFHPVETHEPEAVAPPTVEPQPHMQLLQGPQPKPKLLSGESGPLLKVPDTPFILTRVSQAVHTGTEPRINEQGYDMDNPAAAIDTYYAMHPEMTKKHGYAGTHMVDPNVLQRVVRQAVDKFPELNLTVSRDVWESMTSEAQEEWSKNFDTMRAAQQQYILNEMDTLYPGAINKDPPVILYSGGQAKGYLRVFFVSANEYAAFYWSNNAITGTDSGEYKSAVWDFITHGRNRNEEARFDTRAGYEDTPAGEYTFLGPGNRKVWTYPGPTGMVDYSRGNIPAMLWPAVVTHLTISPNLREVGKLVGGQAEAVVKEYLRRLANSLGGSPHVSAVKAGPVGDVDAARAYFKEAVEKAAEHRGNVMARYPDLRS